MVHPLCELQGVCNHLRCVWKGVRERFKWEGSPAWAALSYALRFHTENKGMSGTAPAVGFLTGDTVTSCQSLLLPCLPGHAGLHPIKQWAEVSPSCLKLVVSRFFFLSQKWENTHTSALEKLKFKVQRTARPQFEGQVLNPSYEQNTASAHRFFVAIEFPAWACQNANLINPPVSVASQKCLFIILTFVVILPLLCACCAYMKTI